MDPCDSCSIEEKLYQCCGRHPMTGRIVDLVLESGRMVRACPHLGTDARCTIYARRPQGCADFICDAVKNQSYRFPVSSSYSLISEET